METKRRIGRVAVARSLHELGNLFGKSIPNSKLEMPKETPKGELAASRIQVQLTAGAIRNE